MAKSGKLYIGTSAWAQKEWGSKFYPPEIPQRRYLEYLSTQFNTVEINATFYRNQSEEIYQKWADQTEPDFVFATKTSRYITHIKRISVVNPYWRRFFEPSAALGRKRGPFLVQLPPSWPGKKDPIERVRNFLKEAKGRRKLRLAFEFRSRACFTDEMLDLLRKHNAALVIANSSKYPNLPKPMQVATADFSYFRLHGPRKLFASSYSDQELRAWAKPIRKFQKQGQDVYVYFNNDQHAHAPENARALQKILGFKR